ncbi:single-stranded DNA-binding protein [Paenisporosarcina cavernae]|uniref:Single-stranded DNA-binding protein n=1 Tax=Paenisporosarcina cavernae TaxID=2320858 RepID=A0A385YTF5_9BACL|nr:single-stranded DNA-binding protein [Paenisporosarcina cavernae]AYC28852.1 single-stranded DNA-binding protein [Paenisporosarcina cavernae]
MNHVGMIGRMTKDPVIRKLSEGRVQATFVLAVQRTFKSQNGEDADFVLCSVWGKIAENTAKFCGKGSLVGVTGRIQSRSYEKEDGNRVFVTEVVGEEVQFLATKPKVQDEQTSESDFPSKDLLVDFAAPKETESAGIV